MQYIRLEIKIFTLHELIVLIFNFNYIEFECEFIH